MKDPLYYHVQQLLIHNNIALDKKELAFQIQSHPSYPSLHAITGVLDHFNVDNIALEIPINEATLAQLPKSFLAQVNLEYHEEFAVVINRGLHYEILLSKNKKSKLTIAEFLDIFTGIIVAVEKTELIEKQKGNNNLITNGLFTISTLAALSLFLLTKPNIVTVLFFVTGILGVLISITLKKQEQGVHTVLGNAFCSGASEKKDCDAVLTSKGANAFGRYKLSDLSLIYFSGLTLAVFTLTVFNINLSIPFVISLLAFPITVYSIYYQVAVVKTWCLLCLSVVAILWGQIGLVALNFEIVTRISFSANSLLVTALGFLSALTIWNILVPNIMALQELEQIKIDHFKFKRNFKLFNSLLKQSKTIDTTINHASEIVFGNPNANLQITIVTSPFCGHCKPVHTLIENILKKYPKQVKILVRFNANTSNPENSLVKITSRLMELYHVEGPSACLNAMHDIYAGQESDSWIKTFGNCKNTEHYFNILKKESDWCSANSINFTPEILVNGRSFPKAYDRSDLIYFIEDLNEYYAIDAAQLQLTT